MFQDSACVFEAMGGFEVVNHHRHCGRKNHRSQTRLHLFGNQGKRHQHYIRPRKGIRRDLQLSRCKKLKDTGQTNYWLINLKNKGPRTVLMEDCP